MKKFTFGLYRHILPTVNLLLFKSNFLKIVVVLFLGGSCSKDDDDLQHESLSPAGEQFMELMHSSANWETVWIEIKKRGSPMPNDAVFAYIPGSGNYAIIPILIQKEISAFVFYHLDPDSNFPIVDGTPEIIQRDAINKDYKSRLFMTTTSFELWKKKGYTLSVHLDPVDYSKVLPPKTKLHDNTNFPFECIITYSSLYNWMTIQEQAKGIFMNVANHLPIRGYSINYIWENLYSILVIEDAPPNSDNELIAELCLSSSYNSIRSILGVSAVQINYLWDDNEQSSGGGGTGTPSEPPTIDRSPKELDDAENKFVRFDITEDCMLTCHAVMDKFGLTDEYGDSGHVFQLLINDNETNTLFYPSDAITLNDAIDCIDIHLNNNRPVIVGVNIKNHPDNVGNADGTDHFVVIIGRGNDSDGYYYTYMETGTSHPYKGYNPSENRLYVNSETNGLTDLSNYNEDRYDVTNVRPNDGSSYNTTAVKSTF